MKDKILIIEDEATLRESLKRVFLREGYQVEAVESAEPALELFEEGNYDLILTDIILPGITGIEFLKRVREANPDQIVIIMTAFASLETAVETLRAGAYDYIVKPIIHEEIKQIVKNALRQKTLQKENLLLKKQMGGSYDLSRIIGQTPEIQTINTRLKKIVEARSPVLFIGEIGTGKKLIARAIHFNSYRGDKPFLPVNCKTFSGDQIEKELFGQMRSPFVTSFETKKGVLEEANGGTIYLENLEGLSLETQLKLLRVIEEQEIRPEGSSQGMKVDLLVIASVGRDPEDLIREGKLRQDLYNWLKVITIKLPPLRDRNEDIEPLAAFFIQRYNGEFSKTITGLTPEALSHLQAYKWPGNIRELRNILERAVLITDARVIGLQELPELRLS
jgi:DNA-binding NtrC family response regulator